MTDISALAAQPSTAAAKAATDARASLGTNFETFLTLLTAQLENQDPLSPMDANQFTEQLVQYSQVEQQIRMNEQLDSLVRQGATAQVGGALAYLGRVATIESDRTALGPNGARWTIALDQPAASVEVSILDAAGRVVANRTLGPSAGPVAFSWDGTTTGGGQAAPGAYRIVPRARDDAGAAVRATVSVEEVITGASFIDGAAQLVTASGDRAFEEIRAIRVADS